QEGMETTSTIATDQPAIRLGDLAVDRTVLLTTYRRDGTPVGTPVHIARDEMGVYVRTFDPSGKLRRIRRDPHVTVAACTVRGRGPGPGGRAPPPGRGGAPPRRGRPPPRPQIPPAARRVDPLVPPPQACGDDTHPAARRMTQGAADFGHYRDHLVRVAYRLL